MECTQDLYIFLVQIPLRCFLIRRIEWYRSNSDPLNSIIPLRAPVVTASVTVSRRTERRQQQLYCLPLPYLSVLNKQMWDIWRSLLANASLCLRTRLSGKPVERKTAAPSRRLVSVGLSPTSFTSSRNFPDPRRLDALRRCPCQRNAAIPSHRVHVATGSSSCSASPGSFSF